MKQPYKCVCLNPIELKRDPKLFWPIWVPLTFLESKLNEMVLMLYVPVKNF